MFGKKAGERARKRSAKSYPSFASAWETLEGEDSFKNSVWASLGGVSQRRGVAGVRREGVCGEGEDEARRNYTST